MKVKKDFWPIDVQFPNEQCYGADCTVFEAYVGVATPWNGITIPRHCAWPYTSKTAHSTPSNYRLQDKGMPGLHHFHPFFSLAALLLFLIVGTGIATAATQERPNDELRGLLDKTISESDSFKDRFDAEVWLMDMSARLKSRVPDDTKRLELLKNIHYEANKVGLAPELVLAVINVESNFNRWAISSAGARGLMQIMPFWLKEIPQAGDNLFDIRTNLRFGCTILKHYLQREKGDFQRALARYNGSLGKVWYPNRVFDSLRKRWFRSR